MKKILMFAVLATAGALFAREPKTYIWPEGKMPYADQTHLVAVMTDESSKKGFNADEWRKPYIEWCDAPKAEKKTDVCMILISGGGYGCCCDVGLVKDWEERLAKLGVTCVNFVYRTPRPKGLPIWQCAWADGQRAVRMVRAEAAKRGFSPDKIGVMSMSAGSHLATLLATSSMTPAYEPVDDLDKKPCNINFACPFAIAYAMTDGVGCPNTRDGDAVDVKLDAVFKFDAQTCPMCMMHGGNDGYSPAASTFVYRELRKRKIPAELHLYPDKGHGAFGFDRAVEFMTQMEILGPLGKEEKLMDRYASDEARGEHIKAAIWPEGKMPDRQEKQCEPYLEWHMPKVLKTKAIQVIWSGGGYYDNVPDGFEVAPFRRYLNEKGMAVVTVKYRVPRPAAPLAKHTTAWQDIQRAIRIVRSEAASRGLDPNRIGIMGSSAGGHLTLMGATSSKRRAYWPIDKIDKLPCNVQWAVAIYPA
ncbi:MAG: alpha/beta hydrolase fold domain-containing protein, partial [Kiritimatiellae bacterium]|nr:alpha/beta hydrolase fold domain-containing protein [Kiritimatiellia bacterium]